MIALTLAATISKECHVADTVTATATAVGSALLCVLDANGRTVIAV